jgi:hypothetical protein
VELPSDELWLTELLDPWRKPAPPTLQAARSLALDEAYELRERIPHSQRSLRWIRFVAWLVFTAVAGYVTVVAPEPNFIFMWIVVTLALGANAWWDHWVWRKLYRQTYLDLCQGDLALRIAEPEFWKVYFYDPDQPDRAGYVPSTVAEALRAAALCLPNMKQRPHGWADKSTFMQALTRPMGAARPISTAYPLPEKDTDVQARYAAIYDFYFDPQVEFDEAVQARLLELEASRLAEPRGWD